MALTGQDLINYRPARGRPRRTFGTAQTTAQAAPAPAPATGPGYITSDLLLHPDNQKLYKDYGFKNNHSNGKAWLNRLMQSSGERAAWGAGLASELEPQRAGAIRALVNNNNPANMVAQARAQGGSFQNQAMSQGNRAAQLLAMRGGNSGAQMGALANSMNQGTDAANQLLLRAYSPEAQNAALIQQLQAIAQARGQGLDEIIGMQGAIAGSPSQPKADPFGQFLATAASVAPLFF